MDRSVIYRIKPSKQFAIYHVGFLSVLASLNLPAAIEDVSGDSVPQSILNKSKSVIEQGGIQTVDQLIKDLPELLQRNKEILDEVSSATANTKTFLKNAITDLFRLNGNRKSGRLSKMLVTLIALQKYAI